MPVFVVDLLGASISILLSVVALWVSGSLNPKSRAFPLLAAIFRIFGVTLKPKGPASFGEKVSALSATLASTSSELDQVLQELGEVVIAKQSMMAELEKKVAQLSNEEKERTKALAELEKISPESAKYFVRLEDQAARARDEQRKTSDRRNDITWFSIGSISSALIAILLHLLHWA